LSDFLILTISLIQANNTTKLTEFVVIIHLSYDWF